ncbi:MAG: hypothetical protein WDO74_28155 [Pseudomonadota bacterium]
MLESQTIDSARIEGGSEFVLARHDQEWIVRVDGRVLMSSRMHDSEEALAEHALERCDDPEAVLVGGLGLGFTLRAVLDRVAPDARVTVAELVPQLVAWNRTHLAELNDRPLDDERCEVVVGDVYDTIKRSPAHLRRDLARRRQWGRSRFPAPKTSACTASTACALVTKPCVRAESWRSGRPVPMLASSADLPARALASMCCASPRAKALARAT